MLLDEFGIISHSSQLLLAFCTNCWQNFALIVPLRCDTVECDKVEWDTVGCDTVADECSNACVLEVFFMEHKRSWRSLPE